MPLYPGEFSLSRSLERPKMRRDFYSLNMIKSYQIYAKYRYVMPFNCNGSHDDSCLTVPKKTKSKQFCPKVCRSQPTPSLPTLLE
jgi:hypothetical protein